MKRVFLHIGTHKTGSTSIQRFLARADDVLEDQGILYPKTGRPDTNWSNQYGQHELYWSLVGKHGIEGDQVWHELRREIDAFSGKTVVLSVEGFEYIGTRDIQRTLKYLQPHSVRVIVYLRPPLHLLKSAYTQRVKMGTYSGPFNRFVEEQTPRCNYLELVHRWRQFDDVESIDIRLFDKVKRDPGLEASFADAAGVDFEQVQSFVRSPTNTSPPDDLVRIARWINKISSIGTDIEYCRTLASRARSNVLGERWPGRWVAKFVRPFLRDTFVTERSANILRDELGEAHRRFLERYVSPEDRTYLEL